MTYETVEQRSEPGVYSVEGIEIETGDCYKTNFYGPLSRERAEEYRVFKQGPHSQEGVSPNAAR